VFKSICADLLERGLEAAFLTHPDGAILYANPAACELFGYTLTELQALGRGAVVDPADPAVGAAIAQRAQTGRFGGVLTMRRKDGSRFSGLLSSAVFTDTDGQQRTAMFVRDLTAIQERENALRVANEELKQALDKVQQLQGLLPICSYCKNIRDDAQYWRRVEDYLSAHTAVRFTHSICPSCYERHVVLELEK
jgi:PAS domain S-box-containing protein